ncbi:hypothetical protein EL26_08975 [Tumebacillus flagellatus]|uniref:DUF58 domain-containing protein n=2 Tax=Tumebacillus flagellatus TaxID=1157490 RepID=A0A074LUD1_9BACL|nr:hypothetical protein EL26_08975 [Tumebacillus flagellatus]
MPMPLVELHIPLPEGLAADFGVKHGGLWRTELVYRTYLLPRQRVTFQQDVLCAERGLHRITKTEIKLGDGLGLSTLFEELETPLSLLVRPRPVTEDGLLLRCEELIGETAVQRWYQEDASRLQGVRSYQAGDPYRFIHWAASARSNQLMVKQFETTSETTLYVIPNAQFFDAHWAGGVKSVSEFQYRVAATLLWMASERQFSCGLCTNAAWQGAGWLLQAADRGPGHLDLLLGLLGGLTRQAQCSYAELLRFFRERVSQASTLLLITPYWSDELEDVLRLLLGDRHRVLILTTTEDAAVWQGIDPAVSVVVLNQEEAS